MIKIIPPTSSCGCGYFKSKCAEIHFQTSSFSILCIFCGMTTPAYADFLAHFQQQHFEDFTKALQCTAEPVVTAVFEEAAACKRSHNDPLEFGEREVATDPEEVMKKLEAHQLELKSLKTEQQTSPNGDTAPSLADHANSASPGASDQELNDFNASDDEYLICKVKLEQCDLLSTAKAVRPRRRCKQTANRLPADSADNDASSGSDSNSEGVDWSKPYEPNLLKNHEKRPYKPRNKPNICNYCGRTFRRRYQLDTHLNIHTGSKPHQCDICGRLFRAVTTLTRHLNTHEQRTVHNCKFCEKAFTHKAALLSHELRHTQQRRVPCDECDKQFYTLNQMDTHKRKVHHKADDTTLPFACDLCPKRYRSASMLSTHKFKKHYRTAKYACEQCGKKFIDEPQLTAHKLIHVHSRASVASS